ncbi:DsbA family protein [Psychrobacter sanguinis]|nr:DsbA family protein [Psychrobacter sanguinis]UEC25141.1 DsbA family protein [Psychrobacter sanguinis]
MTDFMARISETEFQERLKDTTEEAAARGIFGTPIFFMNGKMFFKQDRLGFVETALKA